MHDRPVSYREQATLVPGSVLWQRTARSEPASVVILPDGCLDLIWDGERLFVAGPDTMARDHRSPEGTEYTALRFSGGLGPALLGVPADELCDHTVELADLWHPGEARRLAEKVASRPARALADWQSERITERQPDPLGPRVFAMAAGGVPISDMADTTGLSVRQLHRRCLTLFGYGPRYLARILRLGRALEQARSPRPLAEVAAETGYYDQAHLSREVQALTAFTPTRLLAILDRLD
jgi:AraC-like DNA-binding protein